MSKSMWIIVVLITILMVGSFWFSKGREIPPWAKCKESLFVQVVFKKCTPSSLVSPNNNKNDQQIQNNQFEELPYEPPQN